MPGEGGFIIGCNDRVDWCRIAYGGRGREGWVKMDLMTDGQGNGGAPDTGMMSDQPDRTGHYAPRTFYMNATTGRINVRAGGGLDHPIKFQLQPGDGGVVGKCDDGKTWCEIALPGSEDAGWVYMPLLSPLSE